MDIFIKVVQFLMSLSLLVLIHEFGHFIAAKAFKLRVEKFYLFFDIGFSLFKFRRGETEYGVGWLPLGGYVKISGMIDESMDKEQMKLPPKEYEFRSRPAWQRFIVLVAGVTMNVILAFFIYCGISYTWGSRYISNEDITLGYSFSADAQSLGFRDGDRIETINGEKIDNINSILTRIILADDDTEVGIIRNGERTVITLPYEGINRVRQADDFSGFYTPRIPFAVDSIASESARTAGLLKGDRIVGIDGIHEEDFVKYDSLLAARKGTVAVLDVIRGKDTLALSVPVSDEGKLGVIIANPFPVRTRNYTLLESIPEGARMTGKAIGNYLDQLKLIVKPDTGLYKKVGGFIAIANLFPEKWDWFQFWNMTAFLSLILAILNIIPIPGLDGGHIRFTLWEMVTRRKPSDKVLEVAQYIGLLLILALLVFANGNDIYKLFN